MLNKTCMLGLVTIAAAFGFVCSPARADNAASVTQSADQNTTQIGSGNSSINAIDQTGVVLQHQAPYGNGTNAAALGQYSAQGTIQRGYGNSSVNASNQTGRINQGRSYSHFPYSGNINAAELNQNNGQGVGQLGVGNSSIQAGEQSTILHQH